MTAPVLRAVHDVALRAQLNQRRATAPIRIRTAAELAAELTAKDQQISSLKAEQRRLVAAQAKRVAEAAEAKARAARPKSRLEAQRRAFAADKTLKGAALVKAARALCSGAYEDLPPA